MKVKAKDLDPKVRTLILDTLYNAAGTVQGKDAMKTFLRDMLTESERIMVGRRLLIARELLAENTYRAIGTKLHVGNDTIARIDEWLKTQTPALKKHILALKKK